MGQRLPIEFDIMNHRLKRNKFVPKKSPLCKKTAG